MLELVLKVCGSLDDVLGVKVGFKKVSGFGMV